MNTNMVVILKLRDQEHDRFPPVSRSSRIIPVKDLEDASATCRNFIRELHIQEDEWDGGYVFNGTKQVAFIDVRGHIRNQGEPGFHHFF
jgi:hypothetical protein